MQKFKIIIIQIYLDTHLAYRTERAAFKPGVDALFVELMKARKRLNSPPFFELAQTYAAGHLQAVLLVPAHRQLSHCSSARPGRNFVDSSRVSVVYNDSGLVSAKVKLPYDRGDLGAYGVSASWLSI